MGIGKVTHKELDNFVEACDKLGGVEAPACAELLSDFLYEPTTQINEYLDPFSEEYVQEQIKLYSEISGRSLDQQTNEFTGFDLETCTNAKNPYAYNDPTFISKHARTVLQAVEVANLPPNPKVLDMGCGWGLSTEMIAFCGAHVTCVDINSQFLDLVGKRSLKRGHPVRTIHSNFESLELKEQYDMIFFYECFHHAVRPWIVIEKMAELLEPSGKIILAGEPIQSFWWKHWGIRLDSRSIYCIRKFGWFESGWSLAFLGKLFAKYNLNLECKKKIGFDGGMICVVYATSGVNCTGSKFEIPSRIEIIHNYLRKWKHSPLLATSLGRFLMKFYIVAKPKAVSLERRISSLISSVSIRK